MQLQINTKRTSITTTLTDNYKLIRFDSIKSIEVKNNVLIITHK